LIGRLGRGGRREQRLGRREARRRRPAQDQPHRYGPRGRRHRRQEAVLGDHRPRIGVGQQVAQLGGGQVPVRRHHGDAAVQPGQQHLERLPAVAEHAHQAVPRPHAEPGQGVHPAVDPLAQRGPARPAGGVGDGDECAVAGDVVVQQFRHRPVP
jgi:hypothetical protein